MNNYSNLVQLITCPISHCIMSNPVIVSDGFSYENDEIDKVIRYSLKSPITREKLTEIKYNNYLLHEIIKFIISYDSSLKDELYCEIDMNNIHESLIELCKCKISQKIFKEPVIASDGHTYEKNELIKLILFNVKSSFTNKAFDHVFYQNNIVKQIIDSLVLSNQINIDDLYSYSNDDNDLISYFDSIKNNYNIIHNESDSEISDINESDDEISDIIDIESESEISDIIDIESESEISDINESDSSDIIDIESESEISDINESDDESNYSGGIWKKHPYE
jgi:hypothetical protein